MIWVWGRIKCDFQTHRLCKVDQTRKHICSQPSGQTTGYAFLPLKEKLYVLTFQDPLVLICGHEDPCISYKKSCAFLKFLCSFYFHSLLVQLFPSFWVFSLFYNLGSSLSSQKQTSKPKKEKKRKKNYLCLLLDTFSYFIYILINPYKTCHTFLPYSVVSLCYIQQNAKIHKL